MFYENQKCLFITVIVAVLCSKVNSFSHRHGPPFGFGERREPEPNNPFFFKPQMNSFQPFDPRFIQDKLRSFIPPDHYKLDLDASNIFPNFNHGNHHKHSHDRRPMKEENNAIYNVEQNQAKYNNPKIDAFRVSGPQRAIDPKIHDDNILMTASAQKPTITGNANMQSDPIKLNNTTNATNNAINKISSTQASISTQTTDAYKSTSTEISKVVEIDVNDFGSQFVNDESETEPSTGETTTDFTTTEFYELTTDDDLLNRMGGVPPGVVASLLG